MTFKAKRKDSAPADSPRISDAEWVVLKAVWSLQAATAREVVEKIGRGTDWKPKTIHTLLGRLVRKGAVASTKLGREYVFKPLLGERECRLAASRSFLARVFDGEIAPFLSCFLERTRLTRKEIEELKKILEDKSA